MIVFADRNTRGTYTHVCEISYSYCVHFKKCSKKESVSFARKKIWFFVAQAPSSLRQRAPPPPQPPTTTTTTAATPFAAASSPPAAAASSLHSSNPPPPAAAGPAAGGGRRRGDRNVSHFPHQKKFGLEFRVSLGDASFYYSGPENENMKISWIP